jgi:para-nitrobenzyl esterase
MPYLDLRKASESVLRKANTPMGPVVNLRRAASNLGFGPVIDGSVLPAAPFAPAAPAVSAEVPMIIGTTLNEFATGINHPEYELMTTAELQSRTEGLFPGKGAAIVAEFSQRTPRAKPFDIWSRIASASVRQAALDQAGSKAAQGKSPAYLYWFTWQTPIFDGRPRAFHCAELPFVFYNTDRCENMTGGGARARSLAGRMADAWIRFAATGDPNHAAMPRWTSFSSREAPTLIFDDELRLAMAPDAAELASIRSA